MPTIQIRIDEKTKKDAQKIFSKLGIDMSTAIKIYLKKVIAGQGIPFDVTVASEKELENITGTSQSAVKFWKNKKDDIYNEFYNKKK